MGYLKVLLAALILMMSSLASAYRTYYNYDSSAGDTGWQKVGPDKSNSFWIVCKSQGKKQNLYVSGWHYTVSNHYVKCTNSGIGAKGGHGFLVYCHNWNTIFGYTHRLRVKWTCSRTCHFAYSGSQCQSSNPAVP